jgi:hypothetical protein
MKKQAKNRDEQLISAASSGHINVVKKMLKKGGLNLNFQGGEKDLNFWSGGVLRDENWRDMKAPSHRLGKCGNTALMWACQLHRTKVAAALLDAGANPRLTNLVGETALHLLDDQAACLIDKMVEAGADVNARNAWGATPLMMALHSGSLEVARKLLEHGAHPLIKTVSGHDSFAIAQSAGIDPVFISEMQAMMDKIIYINDLKSHDWYYQYSDDQRVWRAGGEASAALHAKQQRLDPDFLLWNKYAPKEYQHVVEPLQVVELKGKLVAFSETGTEGTVWAFQEDGKSDGYDGLHFLKPGDLLSVFNKSSSKKPIWKGSVDFDYDKNKQPLPTMPVRTALTVQWVDNIGTVRGIQKGVAPEKWAKMFLAEKPARLILPVPPKPKAP